MCICELNPVFKAAEFFSRLNDLCQFPVLSHWAKPVGTMCKKCLMEKLFARGAFFSRLCTKALAFASFIQRAFLACLASSRSKKIEKVRWGDGAQGNIVLRELGLGWDDCDFPGCGKLLYTSRAACHLTRQRWEKDRQAGEVEVPL